MLRPPVVPMRPSLNTTMNIGAWSPSGNLTAKQARILVEESFALELPPYWQDLCDSGKLVSDGWIFCNSFNTERATGGVGTSPRRPFPLSLASARMIWTISM